MWRRKKQNQGALSTKIGPLYRRAYPVGSDRVYVVGGLENRGRFIASELYGVLQRLKGFKSVENHVHELGTRMHSTEPGFISPSQLSRTVQTLFDEGLLVSQEDILSMLRSSDTDETSPEHGNSISVIAWPTKNRHISLLRSISSAVHNFRLHHHDVELHVYDDENPPDSSLSAKLLRFSRRHHMKLRYCNFTEKKTYTDELSGYAELSGEERKLLDFALFGVSDIPNTNGANRNALLLGTAGQRLYSADDDTVFRFTERFDHGTEGRVEVNQREQLLSARHFSTISQALSSVDYRDHDLLELHSRFLGKTLTEILRDSPDMEFELSRMEPLQTVELMRHSDNPVRLSLSGLVGDSGRPNNHMLIGESTLGQLIREVEEEEFSSLLESRSILRYTPSQVLSSHGHFMSTQFAVDNRELIPPFFPNGIGSDGHFGTLFHFISRGGLIAYLPFAFIHAPVKRSNTYTDGMAAIHTRVNDFFIRMIDYIYKSSEMIEENEEGRMRFLGERFVDIAGLSAGHFSDFLREVNVAYLSKYIEHIKHSFSRIDAPPEYLSKVYHTHLDAVKDYMLSDEIAIVKNLEADPGSQRDRFRRIVELFGKLLICWPKIHKGAIAAREEGVLPGRFLREA